MKRPLLVLAVTALAVTACTTGPDPSQAINPDDATGKPTASKPVCDPTTLRTADAEPIRRSKELFTHSMVIDRYRKPGSGIFTIGPSNELLLEVGRSDEAGENYMEQASLRPGRLLAFDPMTGQSQVVRAKKDIHDDTQTVFADMDRDFAVWIEQPGTSLNETAWEIHAANRSTGSITKVAEASKVKGLDYIPTVPGYTIPSLNKGWVYWAEARSNPNEGEQPVANIYGKSLRSSDPPKLMAKNAVTPIATGNWLYYIEFDPERFTKPEYAVYRKSLTTGETTLVHRDKGRDTKGSAGKAAFLAAHDDLVAWSLSDTVLVFDGTKQIAEVRASGGSLSWLDAGENAIGFTDGSDGPGTHYLLDLNSGCLHALGNGDGLGQVLITDNTVVWFTPEKNRKERGPSEWHYARLR